MQEHLHISHKNEITVNTANFLDIGYQYIKKDALVMRALNHKLRQQLITVINENRSLTVTQIFNKLGLDKSVASQHLAIVRKAGIVTTQREGKFIYYSINTLRAADIKNFVNQLVA